MIFTRSFCAGISQGLDEDALSLRVEFCGEVVECQGIRTDLRWGFWGCLSSHLANATFRTGSVPGRVVVKIEISRFPGGLRLD